MSYIDFEKAYNRVNRKALWNVLRMYDGGGKLLSGIKNMYVDSLVCVRVKGDVSKQFKIVGWDRCIMSPWPFNVYIEFSDVGSEDGDGKEGCEIPGGGEKVEISWSFVCR